MLLHPLQEQRRSFQAAANHGRGSLGPHPSLFKAQRTWKWWGSPTHSQLPARRVHPAKGGKPFPTSLSTPSALFFSPVHVFGEALETPGRCRGEISPLMTSGHTLHPIGHGHIPGVALIPKILSSSPLSHQDSRKGLCKSQGAFGALRIPERTGMVLPHPPPSQTLPPHIPAPRGTPRPGGALFLLHH